MTLAVIEPRPLLMLESRSAFISGHGGYGHRQKTLDYAAVWFAYGDVQIDAGSDATHVSLPGDPPRCVPRDLARERQWLAQLAAASLYKISTRHLYTPTPLPRGFYAPLEYDDWYALVRDGIPQLRRQGWQVTMADDFSYNVIEIDQIDGEAQQGEGGWFDLSLGVEVNGETLRLEPLLASLFARDPRWLSQPDAIDDRERVQLVTDGGIRLVVQAQRLKPLVRNLIDLFDQPTGGALRLPPWDAGRLSALEQSGRWQFRGDSAVRELAQRLREGARLDSVPPPAGLRATLRPYQQQGLSWMQFLRRHHLGGVLADDMGLGKTLQTLAHILTEKEAGRLTRPALVVVPTSLVWNWQQEAAHFTPDLRVLALTGAGRRQAFAQRDEADVVLTTYALVWRDLAVFGEQPWHLLILDEAHYVKNSHTRAARAVRALEASHRLCLTGTPLENHLGELWSQFDFLLPGWLGNERQFTLRWRQPIEKQGDTLRRELLARRIRPFILRRRKSEVATELPAKTTIVRKVELEGAQRDLYETVRLALQAQLRHSARQQPSQRQRVRVLDALLKLRQICCDPRLVRLEAAGKVKGSAKLSLLRDLVDGLVAEGRRILIFSQFSGMLALIASELSKVKIPWVMLTGDTADRTTPVQRFQRGEVPLFLISLKAGGVGLNLTAADTVIHYDPWWNPAAEAQATDRAYRIGQHKQVFVYKLITAGTIEEKIVSLQARKAELADSLFDEEQVASPFSEEEIAALLDDPGV
ncbi:DEAD/DEAH box helicase [Pantoea sp. 1.19]|uniref:DEAD/DEAH box helicase n=1 Tax=Pantoea sp. 1.19 TaxID=1925589 RepID=UPI000948ABA1|nr:DEAD/DEAH box helicase [Pantoea sp. 1.19]